MYQKARGYWAELADRAHGVYQPDVTVGEMDIQRGHWLDRLPAIDEDIALMAKKLEQTQRNSSSQPDNVRLAIEEAMGRPIRVSTSCHHFHPEHFKAGEPLDLELSVEKAVSSVLLYYRHVNHAERYNAVEMRLTGKSYSAIISAEYTNSKYPLQYYFEMKETPAKAWLFPGFSANLMNQPYFIVRKG
jgi:hypothetical protein